jgi:hypothetical protein
LRTRVPCRWVNDEDVEAILRRLFMPVAVCMSLTYNHAWLSEDEVH